MQKRHTDRRTYFQELATTSEKYYITYLREHMELSSSTKVLEVGCGEGGNLLPFIDLGCQVMGVDQSTTQVERAHLFLSEHHENGFELVASDFLQLASPECEEERFDLILLHDVIEHIEAPFKEAFLRKLSVWLKEDGLLFVGFPAWQMPFGGHQQICQSKVASKIPFVHLLPTPLYRQYLKACGESEICIDELMSIKRSSTSIELFEKLVAKTKLAILDRVFWFINPHYEVKFGLSPRKLIPLLGKVPWLRNFFSTSCFYLLRK